MVTPKFFKVTSYIILKEVFYIDRFGWLPFLGVIIISKFAFVDSRS